MERRRVKKREKEVGGIVMVRYEITIDRSRTTIFMRIKKKS